MVSGCLGQGTDEDLDFYHTEHGTFKKDPVHYKTFPKLRVWTSQIREKDGKQIVYPMRLRMVRFLLIPVDTNVSLRILKEKHSPWRIRGIIPFEMGNRNIIPKIKYSLGLSSIQKRLGIRRTGDIRARHSV